MKWIFIMSAGTGATQWICCSSVCDGQGSVTNLHLKQSLIKGPGSVWESVAFFFSLVTVWTGLQKIFPVQYGESVVVCDIWPFFAVIPHSLMPERSSRPCQRRVTPESEMWPFFSFQGGLLACLFDFTFLTVATLIQNRICNFLPPFRAPSRWLLLYSWLADCQAPANTVTHKLKPPL